MFAACRRSGLVPESVEVLVLVDARRRLGRREGRPARVTVVGCSASWASRHWSSLPDDPLSEPRRPWDACHLRRCRSLCAASRSRQDLCPQT